MSRSLNKVMLIGNVGKKPEIKHTPSGIPIATFRLATTEVWRERNGNIKENTEWHTIVAWRSLADIAVKILDKGSTVYVEGRLQTRIFEEKSGFKRHKVEILADNILILNSKRRSEEGSEELNKSDDNSGESEELENYSDGYSSSSDYVSKYDDDSDYTSSSRSSEIPF